jgi:hypothetical protein
MMKKLGLIIALTGFSFLSFTQTAEEIVSKYLQNIGGTEKLAAIKNVKMYANVDQMGMSIPIEMISTVDGKMIVKGAFQGMEFVQMAYDGQNSWGTNFMTMKAEKNSSEDSENMKRMTGDFITPLYNYQTKGYKLEKLSDETVEGVSCFKLKLTKKPILEQGIEIQNVDFIYLDKDNYVPIVQESEIPSGEMKGKMQQSLFSDYQEVNGVMFPFSMTSRVKDIGGQTINFNKIETNISVEDKVFAFPGE